MDSCYLGEIRMFGGNFAPRNWALCNGQQIAVEQHPSLFSLLGTAYGGDGRNYFNLPDMRGRIPVCLGQGSGLTNRYLGCTFGSEEVTLFSEQVGVHSHPLQVSQAPGSTVQAAGRVFGRAADNVELYSSAPRRTAAMAPSVVSMEGGGDAHDNIMPSLCIHFIIALVGTFPPRFSATRPNAL